MPVRAKLIRRVIVALEIAVLIAVFLVARYASTSKHYQIVYADPYAPGGGIDLVLIETGKTTRLLDTLVNGVMACDIDIQVENTASTFGGERSAQPGDNRAVLHEFWTSDAVEIMRDERRAVVRYDNFRVEIRAATCAVKAEGR